MNSTIKVIIGLGLLVLGVAAVWTIYSSSNPAPVTDQTPAANPTMPPATGESPSLIGTVWTANSVSGQPVIANTSITAQFDDQGRLTGSDGCNSFSGSYTLAGSALTIDPAMASTEMACEEAIMTQADTFTQTLLATTGYLLGDGMLVLTQEEVEGLTFSGQSNPLSKTSWSVTGYNNGKQAVVSPILNTNLTMTFGDDGTISGNSGCNTYSGQYTLSGQTITISPLASTMRACIEPEGVAEQETAFTTALQQAATWNIQGNQLSLRTAENAIAVTGVNSLTADPNL